MVARDSTRRAVDRAGHRVRAGDSLAGGGLQSDAVGEGVHAGIAADEGVVARQDGLTVWAGAVVDSGVGCVGVAVGGRGGDCHIESSAGGSSDARSTDLLPYTTLFLSRDSTRRAVDRAGHRVRAGDGLAGGGLQSDAVREGMHAGIAADEGVVARQDGLTDRKSVV